MKEENVDDNVTFVHYYIQQHGTVYWGKGSRNHLHRLDPAKFLHGQLVTSFSVSPSPVWMDSSTGKECHILEEILGGPEVRISFFVYK